MGLMRVFRSITFGYMFYAIQAEGDIHIGDIVEGAATSTPFLTVSHAFLTRFQRCAPRRALLVTCGFTC